jgi:hypothetical protein
MIKGSNAGNSKTTDSPPLLAALFLIKFDLKVG